MPACLNKQSDRLKSSVRQSVAVSTTNTDPSSFTVISSGSYVEAPVEAWTEFSYDLSSYAGQNIYVAIVCVSADAFIFMVDDIYMGPAKSGSKDFVEYNVYLDNMTTPVATTTSLNYTFTDLNWETSYTAYVSSKYTSDESDLMSWPFVTGTDPNISVGEVNLEDQFTIYPNPAQNVLNIKTNYKIDRLEVYSTIGERVITQENYENGLNVEDLTEGIYIIQISSGDNVITKRVSINR